MPICTAFIVILLLCFVVTRYSRWLRRVTCIHIIYTRRRLPPVDPSTKALCSKIRPLNHFIRRQRCRYIRCRSSKILRYFVEIPTFFVNYSTMKIEIAFMLNLERPITATATASRPRLPYRWNLQGGGNLCHSDLCFVLKSVPHQINVLYYFRNSENFLECSKSHIIHLSDGKQILRQNTNHCNINALPPVNSNGKKGVAMKQPR